MVTEKVTGKNKRDNQKNTRGISMEYIHNLIWLCPLLFIAGFIDSIAGGGGLIALPAYMMCGMPIYYVYGCNKFQCAFGSTEIL